MEEHGLKNYIELIIWNKLRTTHNIINRTGKENCLELKHSGGKPSKLNRCDRSKILKNINNNPKNSSTPLATFWKTIVETVSHETVRIVQKKIAKKKHLLSALNIERRVNFSIAHVNKRAEYWDGIIFREDTKIMMYYHDGSSKLWRKPNTTLQQKKIYI